MRTPKFWYKRERTGLASLLLPVSGLYRLAGKMRGEFCGSWRAMIPVLCVGNATAGGAGKTPVAMSLAKRLTERGHRVHFLTRGYGGGTRGPMRVDPQNHKIAQVGDEALLLAHRAPTWVARNRRAGCRAATLDGAGVIIMDDGYQNPSVEKNVSVLVVDGTYGFGNNHLLPAGPLREPLSQAVSRADAVVLIGTDQAGVSDAIQQAATKPPPILHARFDPGPEADQLKGKPVVAFAGIGLPEKFFDLLRAIGCKVIATHAFADHHTFTEADMTTLRHDADAQKALLVTTEKDAVRLSPEARAGIAVLPVSVTWQDELALDDLLDRLFPPE